MGVTGILWVLNARALAKKYGHHMSEPESAHRWYQIGIGGTLLAALVAAIVRYGQPLSQFSREFSFRFTILTDTWRMWKETPLLGIGPGTFPVVFRYYQSESLGRVQVAHAHCDPLQWWAELGAIGFAVSVVLMTLVILFAVRCRSEPTGAWPSFRELEGRAFGLALLVLILHSLVDFPFRMPAITWVAAAWLGLACAWWERKSDEASR